MPNDLENDLFTMYQDYDDEQEFYQFVKDMNEFTESLKHKACPKCNYKTLEPIGLNEAQCFNCNHKLIINDTNK